MVHLAGRSQRGRARPLYCLVITLDRIRPGTAVGAPKSEPPAYASESSVSGQLLVMCVPGACGVAGTVCGSCACEMLLCVLVITMCTNYRLHRYLFTGVVVTAVRSNGLRAPQHLNACDWVPRFTIDSTA